MIIVNLSWQQTAAAGAGELAFANASYVPWLSLWHVGRHNLLQMLDFLWTMGAGPHCFQFGFNLNGKKVKNFISTWLQTHVCPCPRLLVQLLFPLMNNLQIAIF